MTTTNTPDPRIAAYRKRAASLRERARAYVEGSHIRRSYILRALDWEARADMIERAAAHRAGVSL